MRFNTHATAIGWRRPKGHVWARFLGGLDYQTLSTLFRQRGLKCWRGQGFRICRGINAKKPLTEQRLFGMWRRDRDLNPRRAINPCRFSRPVLSTTQPSLRNAAYIIGFAVACKPFICRFLSARSINDQVGEHASKRRLAYRHSPCF